MCGIVAILRRTSDREPPAPAHLLALLERAQEAAGAAGAELPASLPAAATAMEKVDALLRGVPGVIALLGDAGLAPALDERAATIESRIGEIERDLDAGAVSLDGTDLEDVNAALVRLRDALWSIRKDRLRCADAVRELLAGADGRAAVEAYTSIQVALSAIDRLEVRGRDSAGIHVFVEGHGLDLGDPTVTGELAARNDPLFTANAVDVAGPALSFVYKAAAEIGDLGDNTAKLRSQISADALLRRAVVAPDAVVTVLGHTRWASVGAVSEANAHPLNSYEPGREGGPVLVAALNGDVDNHVELRARHELRAAPEITTDAKVIPLLASRFNAGGEPLDEAFRRAVASFEGSVAIGLVAADEPGRVRLALRGSGQALYVGLAEDAFVVASEPYGLIEETSRYVRMDGEARRGSVTGQIITIDRAQAGELRGVARTAYDGSPLAVSDADVMTAPITTRDVDRAGNPHYLIKEIYQAPSSMRKTLRGRISDDGHGHLTVTLPDASLPALVRERLAAGEIRRIIVTGQGTAAIAAQSAAASVTEALRDRPVITKAVPATELSGFEMTDDMSDTLVVAISQSGTTADTNRTVDLVRARGAAVIAIVNRRSSDLVEKADGVIYTSDGRDVEMAVPSTKAFYAQVAAGVLLAWAIADAAGVRDAVRRHRWLEALRQLPAALEQVLARRDDIALVAQRHTPSRRHWAVVGNGPNRVAAHELRIKLSELCYKSIAFDLTEEKKHIDLCAEPMILVCAAGLDDAIADDVGKEVAIFRAHKAAPIVIASEGSGRFEDALSVIHVPAVHPELDFVLTAMAGHLFGYEAALAIDAQARLLREARSAVEGCVEGAEGHELLGRVAGVVEPAATSFFTMLREGALNGNLEVNTATRLSSLFRYATGALPVEAYELEYGRVGSPAAVVDDLVGALNEAIDELTRPVDAIKHQAKTVTVGTSRTEETYADVALVQAALAAGAPRDRLSYRSLRSLAALDASVAEATGYTRYAVEGSVTTGEATIHVLDKGGVAASIASRTETDPRLRGTKRRAATEREVTVTRGAADGRTLVIVPEVKDNQVTGITLLHVRFHERLDPDVFRDVLSGYRNRYNALVDAVCETEPVFDDRRLGQVDVAEILVEPVRDLAALWRAG